MKKNSLHLQNIGFYLLLALTTSIVSRAVRFPGDDRIVRLPDVTLSDTIYYIGESLTRVWLMMSAWVSARLFVKLLPNEPVAKGLKIIVEAMLLLAIGKLLDDVFGQPSIYSIWEKFFDGIVLLLTLYKFYKWNLTANKNQQI